MKTCVILFGLALSGCATSQSLSLASRDLSPGYPVFVDADQRQCIFQVQDMILKSRSLSDWMMKLPSKSRQIDLVTASEHQACVERAAKIVRSAGFTNVILRRMGDVEYPSGLPPI